MPAIKGFLKFSRQGGVGEFTPVIRMVEYCRQIRITNFEDFFVLLKEVRELKEINRSKLFYSFSWASSAQENIRWASVYDGDCSEEMRSYATQFLLELEESVRLGPDHNPVFHVVHANYPELHRRYNEYLLG